MIKVSDISEYVKQVLAEVNAGLESDGCNAYRLKSISFGGEVVFGDATVPAQIATSEPITDSVVVSEETPSTETQTTSDTVAQTTQRGGDKIFERESTTEE